MLKKIFSFVLIIGVVFFNLGFFLSPRFVIAAGTITSFSDTVSNLTANAAANHTIKFTTPTGIAASQTLVLTFGSGLDLSSIVFGDIDLADDGVDVAIGPGPAGTTWGAGISGQVITFTNGTTAVAAGSVVTIEIGTHAISGGAGTHQIVNGAAGSVVLRVSGSPVANADIGTLSITIVPNSIVAVSAEVTPSLNFSVSSNALYFGNLNSAASCFAKNTDPGYVTCPQTTEAEAFNMVAGTNGATGYTITVQGDTLRSGLTNTITPLAVNTASALGTEQFGLRMTATGGSGSVTAPYAAAGYAYTGSTTTAAQVASSTIPSANTTYSVRYLANISAVTEAGSYSTSHTYVATGNF